MELGIRLRVQKEPIGIFVWHGNNLSSTGADTHENALADIDRHSAEILRAKRFYRLRKLLAGGYLRLYLYYELIEKERPEGKRILFPRLKIRGFDKSKRS
jgi:hypothetical protein